MLDRRSLETKRLPVIRIEAQDILRFSFNAALIDLIVALATEYAAQEITTFHGECCFRSSLNKAIKNSWSCIIHRATV